MLILLTTNVNVSIDLINTINVVVKIYLIFLNKGNKQ